MTNSHADRARGGAGALLRPAAVPARAVSAAALLLAGFGSAAADSLPQPSLAPPSLTQPLLIQAQDVQPQNPASPHIGRPIPLTPPEAAPAPSPESGAAPDSAASASPSAPVPLTPSGGISADGLSAPNFDGASALAPDERGLTEDMWRGSSTALATALLPHIVPSISPALQDLGYRLLASPATPPADDKETGGALLAVRAERLTALGRADSALLLLQAAPAPHSEPAARLTADLAFTSGNVQAACGLIDARDPNWHDPFWAEARIGCAVLRDQTDQAQLGLDVLRDADPQAETFIALVQFALGSGAGADAPLPDRLPEPQSVSMALLAKAHRPLPMHALDSASLSVLRYVALAPGFPPDQRLAAAERAAALGAIPPSRLDEAYLAAPLDEAAKSDPLARARTLAGTPDGGSMARAVLFNGAHDATDHPAKAALAAALLDESHGALFPAVAAAVQDILLDVPPEDNLRVAAPAFARALYATGRVREAQSWFALAAPDEQARLLPLAAAATGALPAGEEGVAPITDPGLLLILEAAGIDVPDGPLADLAAAKADGRKPDDPARLDLAAIATASAGTKRIGPTVAAVLASLGEDGPAASPQLVAAGIQALRQAGLGREAKRLAVDAVLARSP